MERKEYQLHDIIFEETDHQKWMYSICEGTVDICIGYGTIQEKKLITLTRGQFFGEIGMITAMPRTATAIATSERVVLEQICLEDFEDYLNNHPENLQPIMSSVSGRIRKLTEDLSMITQMTDEALRKKENGNFSADWLTGSIRKLLAKLKATEHAGNEFTILCKRQQALSGEFPPVIRFDAGDVIFRAGEQADCMYDIYDGSVGIYSGYQKENEKLLTKLNAGDVFGEMGLLDNMPRSASAVCLSNCIVLVIKRENFMRFFQNKSEKVLKILQQMCAQLRNLTETYLQVCKVLEQMPALEKKDLHEEEALSKLEHMRQCHLCSCMYDISSCRDCGYDHF